VHSITCFRALWLAALLAVLVLPCLRGADTFALYEDAAAVPQTALQVWQPLEAGLRREPLAVEVVEEWNEDGITCRLVRFTVCTVRGVPSRVAAFYTFPTGGTDLPGFVWAHGGGQRADRTRGEYFARHGYATLDINWLGREMLPDQQINTDWGKIDPSQGPQFYPGALRKQFKPDLQPDAHAIDPVASPRNSSWFLLAYTARRGLTFLEQQPEVDAERLGMTGFSMGGNITSYSVIDSRLKAVIPMVGGTGFITEDYPGVPGSAPRGHLKHADLFSRTVDSAAFYAHAICPVLFLSATNDFHGILDNAFRCGALLPHGNWRVSQNLHYNHALSAEQWILINRWFDLYLKGEGAPLARMAPATLEVDGAQATFTVAPEQRGAAGDELVSVEVLYSRDPNPIARFWKTAPAREEGDSWSAQLPVRQGTILRAFAQCTYRFADGEQCEALEGGATATYSITSALQTYAAGDYRAEAVRQQAVHDPVFHDFVADGLSGWSGGDRGNLRTYRPRDPDRATPPAGAALVCHFAEVPRKATLRVHLSKNEFLFNKQQKQTFIASRPIGEDATEIRFTPADFKLQGGEQTLSDWSDIVHLSIDVIAVDKGRHVHLARDYAGSVLRRITW
jgi:dienelactone hydrolase